MKGVPLGLIVAAVGIAFVVATGVYMTVTVPTPPPWFSECGLTYGTTTSSKPAVTLLVSPSSLGEQVLVAGMQPDSRWSASCYQVALDYNGSYTTAVRLTTGGNTTVAVAFVGGPPIVAGTFLIRWNDVDGDGHLGSGDSFLITHSGGLPSPGVYGFLLVWGDGSTLTQVSFAT